MAQIVSCWALVGCAPTRTAVGPEREETTAEVKDPALREVLSRVDLQADPCESFYAFACGAMEPSDGGDTTENRMYYRLDDALWKFMSAPATDPPSDRTTRVIRGWVAACRNDDARTAAGTTALAPLLQRIDAVVDVPSFMAAVGSLQAQGVGSVLRLDLRPGGDGLATSFWGPHAAHGLDEADPSFDAEVDLAGLRLTLALYRESLPTPAPGAAGLSADALFFVSAARLFCMPGASADEERATRSRRRIDAAMAALPEFAETFACAAEDPMRMEHDCSTW